MFWIELPSSALTYIKKFSKFFWNFFIDILLIGICKMYDFKLDTFLIRVNQHDFFENPSDNPWNTENFVVFLTITYRYCGTCLSGYFYNTGSSLMWTPCDGFADRSFVQMSLSKAGTSVKWAIWARSVDAHLREVSLYFHSLICTQLPLCF
jgi:hypothetical protein